MFQISWVGVIYGDNDSGYDTGIVIRVVEFVLLFFQANPHQKYLWLED